MLITKEMGVNNVLEEYPSLVNTFIESGLPCLVCGEPFWDTIEELTVKYNVNVNNLADKLHEQKWN